MANHPHEQKPLLPRLHLFEINDQAWFPPFLRARVQAGLTHAWTAYIPGLQPSSPAALVADILLRNIGPDNVPRYTYIDFCSGAGGPTPIIERSLNRRLLLRAIENGSGSANKSQNENRGDSHNEGLSYADVAKQADASQESTGNDSHNQQLSTDSTRDDTPSYAEAAKQISSDDIPRNDQGGDGPQTQQQESSNSTLEDAPSYAEVAQQISTDELKSGATKYPASFRKSNDSKDKDGHEASPSSSDSTEDDNAFATGVDFVLTDLHPHPTAWEEAARNSARLHYVARPVNAAAAPRDLVSQATSSITTFPGSGRSGPVKGRSTFRLFNLAFHHFDDAAARSILRDTLATSSGFGIFELQDRSLSSFATCLIFGAGVFLFGLPLYWWSPLTLFFVYIMPLIPLVLVFDGFVSSLRTRTPAEVEMLLKSCGDKEFESGKWEIRSGRERFMWPTGHLNWIICTKKEDA